MTPKNLTPKQFAERMQMSLDMVYARIRDKTLPFVDQRGKGKQRPVWRISSGVVEELEKGRLNEGGGKS